ncbi:hypothetical protein ALI144C_02865 [Actinosynnema sp. ALI-1.44]|uniref:hypothetical protein n=1 Tax=Actinosynnema sp. ALI-1.44 TaxID=1933779 RepID=UPI00097BDFA4|nr:hypothetical protein [Actinosynnema sp. ALI-1.44]ONI90630.1 hypothetical protein ALI144C_02865 [Actinosynnema sp. ALI-1.44]
MIPATDLEAVTVGLLMQLPVDTARLHLARLEPGDFTDWRAATTVTLLADMLTAGLSSVDPAAVLGYALRTGAVAGEHKLKRVAEWIADAHRTAPFVPATLDFHIDLLLEATYRRHVVQYATRLSQAEKNGALDLLDGQITTGYARLKTYRDRFTTHPARLHAVTDHTGQGAA